MRALTLEETQCTCATVPGALKRSRATRTVSKLSAPQSHSVQGSVIGPHIVNQPCQLY